MTDATDPQHEPTPNARGLLLLDVDGPLNPVGGKPWHRPKGYSAYRLTLDGHWYRRRNFRRNRGLRIWLNPDDGHRILNLAAETRLQLAWATAWLDQANAYVGPVIGLPKLPVIAFPATDYDPNGFGRKELGHGWQRGGSWKYAAVAKWAEGTPLAWWDDDFNDPRSAEAKEEFLRVRGDLPTLLCEVDPRAGLRDHHLDQVRAWAAELPI